MDYSFTPKHFSDSLSSPPWSLGIYRFNANNVFLPWISIQKHAYLPCWWDVFPMRSSFAGSCRTCSGPVPYLDETWKGLNESIHIKEPWSPEFWFNYYKNYIPFHSSTELWCMLFFNYCTSSKILFLEYISGKWQMLYSESALLM